MAIYWQPIAEMHDYLKDGRVVLFAFETGALVPRMYVGGYWFGDKWMLPVGRPGDPTHFAEIDPPTT